MKEPKQTLAVRIVAALGAYCPKVKLFDEKILAREAMVNKRRKRPMLGRGNYGRDLMAYFDSVRFQNKLEKQWKSDKQTAPDGLR